jgi:hypothetical protein
MIKRPRALCLSITRISVGLPYGETGPRSSADPAAALHRLKNLDTAYQDEPHEPEDDGEGPGTVLPAQEEADHRSSAHRSSVTPAGLEKVKEAKAAKDHGREAIYLSDKNGQQCLCPHCGQHMEGSAIYTDAKGWTFHRPCLHKGAVKLREKRASDVFLVDYLMPLDEEQFDLDQVKQAVAPPVPSPVQEPSMLAQLIGSIGSVDKLRELGDVRKVKHWLPSPETVRKWIVSDDEMAKFKEDAIGVLREELRNGVRGVTDHTQNLVNNRIDQVNDWVGRTANRIGDGIQSGVAGVGQGINNLGKQINAIQLPNNWPNPAPPDWRTPVALGAGALATGLGGYGLYRYLRGRRRREDEEKQAQMRSNGYRVNAPTPEAANNRDRNTMMTERSTHWESPTIPFPPGVLYPAVGASAGAIIGDHPSARSRAIGALRGLAAGSGAALGHYGANYLSNGDSGSEILGSVGGGMLAYLLARAVTSDEVE